MTSVGPAGAGLAHRALRRVRAAVPAAGSHLGTGPIRLQTIRAGFPCFDAALAGYVEATRDDAETQLAVSPEHPPRQPRQLGPDAVRGTVASATLGAEPQTSPPGPTAAP